MTSDQEKGQLGQAWYTRTTNRRGMRFRGIRLCLALGIILGAVWMGTGALACTRVGTIRLVSCGPARTPPHGSSGAARAHDAEQYLIRAINRDRAARGLDALELAPRTARDMARTQARAMGRRDELFHNPRLRSADGRRALGFPTEIAENVGAGPDAETVYRAFMASSRHRAAILDGVFRRVAVGAFERRGTIWVSGVFVSAAYRVEGATAISAGRAIDRATVPDRTSARVRPDYLPVGESATAARPRGGSVPIGLALCGVAVLAAVAIRRRQRKRSIP